METSPETIVLRRLRRMLQGGAILAVSGLLLMMVGMKLVFEPASMSIAVGLLATLLGIGTFGAAWLGYTIRRAWQFRLRTMLTIVTVAAVLCAAWTAWIGPHFFEDVHISWHENELTFELPPPENVMNPGGGVIITKSILQFPIMQPGPFVLLFFPLLLLPFVLRSPRLGDDGHK